MSNQLSAEELERIDDQIRSAQTHIAYDTKEYVVELIVNRFDTQFFFIPDYQRNFVWDTKKQSKFIESVLMGLPIPFMFGVENTDGNIEILDGAQRINTLSSFLKNELVLESMERLDLLDGVTFEQLPSAQKKKLLDRSMRMVILPETVDLQVKLDMFERINTGSLDLKDSEIRKGAYSGDFFNFIQECAEDEQFNRLCPVSVKGKNRGEREELVLRFFAYSDGYQNFKHSVSNFLDTFLLKKNKEGFDKDLMFEEFRKVLNYVERNIPAGFAKTIKAKSTPRVRFEAISIGINLALRDFPDLPDRDMTFLDGAEFKKQVTSHASNSGPRLKGRVEHVRNSLLEN
jgi:hypothetical protein